MIFTHGKTRGRVTEYKTDDYGRWSWMRLDTHRSGIVIVSIYQPSNQEDYKLDGNKSKKTFRLQQHSMILQDKRKGSPREIFRKDLIKFLNEVKTNGDKILIMGDFNEVFDTNSGIMDVATEIGLVDIMENKMKHQEFSTHMRNKNNQRIDYALGSPELLDSVHRCGYQAFGKDFKGDHRGFYIDFKTNKLFGAPLHELVSLAKRGICSKDKKNRARYINSKYKELIHHNFFERLSKLCVQENKDPEEIEKLDNNWLRSSIIAENRCAARYNIPYTVMKLQI